MIILAFVIDHEIYHCLKSMYVGPQMMSKKTFWGNYNYFLNELGADAYALGMHIKNRNEVSLFPENILRIRGMSLYNADPNHLTCKALEQVLQIPATTLSAMSDNEVFDTANSIKNKLLPGYDEYVRYIVAMVQAMKEIGVKPQISEELLNKIKDIQADPALVEELVENSRHCHAELSSDEFEP